MKKGRKRTLYLSDELWEELGKTSNKTGISKSKIVERGTRRVLKKLKEIEDNIW